MTTLTGHRAGKTYNDHRDRNRLNGQTKAVYGLMRDREWRTLDVIAAMTGAPPASASARLRDLRKKRYGGYLVDREHIGKGVWRYRVRKPRRAAA